MITTEIPWNEYTRIERMNPSTLVAGIKSMRHLFIRMRDGFGEPSDPMRFGTGLHALLLESEDFESRFCVMPDFHKDEGNTTYLSYGPVSGLPDGQPGQAGVRDNPAHAPLQRHFARPRAWLCWPGFTGPAWDPRALQSARPQAAKRSLH